MLILTFGSKVVLRTISDNLTQKNHYFTSLLAKYLLEISVTLATPKVPGDQKLFGMMCYMFIGRLAKVQLATPNGF